MLVRLELMTSCSIDFAEVQTVEGQGFRRKASVQGLIRYTSIASKSNIECLELSVLLALIIAFVEYVIWSLFLLDSTNRESAQTRLTNMPSLRLGNSTPSNNYSQRGPFTSP